MFQQGIVAVAGARSLAAGEVALVQEVARGLVEAGCSLVVGCASGADEAALSAVPVSACRVLSAFGPGGQGACRWSAVSAVSGFAAAGGSVAWWAGGGPAAPLRARLVGRTAAVVSAAGSGLVVFPGPNSRGTVNACRAAVRRGLPLVVFPLGGAALPDLGRGHWASLSSGGKQWLTESVDLFSQS